jgi:DNA repair ATPase RecN
VTLESFTAEQEKMHDDYEKRKQQLIEKSDSLHKELEKLETDLSTNPRQEATKALANAINAYVQRTPVAPQNR